MSLRQQHREILRHLEDDEFGPLTRSEREHLLALLASGDSARIMHLAGRLAQVGLLAGGVTEEELAAGYAVTNELEGLRQAGVKTAAAATVTATVLLLNIGLGPDPKPAPGAYPTN